MAKTGGRMSIKSFDDIQAEQILSSKAKKKLGALNEKIARRERTFKTLKKETSVWYGFRQEIRELKRKRNLILERGR